MKIVVGVDGSEGATRALAWAIDEAGRRRAEVEVVLAFELPTARYVLSREPLPAVELEAAARRRIDELIGANRPEGVSIVERPVATASVAEALIDASDEADLLVVGSRGLGGFHGLLVGSVSQQCVTHARCPVVIVP